MLLHRRKKWETFVINNATPPKPFRHFWNNRFAVRLYVEADFRNYSTYIFIKT